MKAYYIQLTHSDGTVQYGYRNKKGEWSAVTSTCLATSYKTERGAWRTLDRGDDLLLSAYGSACWYDRLQRLGYTVNVVLL